MKIQMGDAQFGIASAQIGSKNEIDVTVWEDGDITFGIECVVDGRTDSFTVKVDEMKALMTFAEKYLRARDVYHHGAEAVAKREAKNV